MSDARAFGRPRWASLAPLFRLVLFLFLLGGALLPASSMAQSVAVVSSDQSSAVAAVSAGVKEALARARYTEARGLKWQMQSVQGSAAMAAKIIRNVVGSRPTVIVAIGAQAAKAAVGATSTIPIVYAAVTDPVAVKLVPSADGASGTNVTGVSDYLSLDKQVDLIEALVPDAVTVGMVYDPHEPDSVALVASLREVLSKRGMSLVEAVASHPDEVGAAARSLIDKADVFYTNADSTVMAAYAALVKTGNDAKIPLIATDTDSVRLGAVAALGVNYHDLGVQAGGMVVKILKGAKPGEMPQQAVGKPKLFVNETVEKKLHLTLPSAVVKSGVEIIK